MIFFAIIVTDLYILFIVIAFLMVSIYYFQFFLNFFWIFISIFYYIYFINILNLGIILGNLKFIYFRFKNLLISKKLKKIKIIYIYFEINFKKKREIILAWNINLKKKFSLKWDIIQEDDSIWKRIEIIIYIYNLMGGILPLFCWRVSLIFLWYIVGWEGGKRI